MHLRQLSMKLPTCSKSDNLCLKDSPSQTVYSLFTKHTFWADLERLWRIFHQLKEEEMVKAQCQILI
jgi:hypothetical protein